MIIEKVELRNFRSHKEAAVEFDKGVNVIVGENGAGKTSILEAINFALFRETPRRVKLNDLITRGSEGENMTVALTFQANGKKLRVERTRGKSNTDKLFLDSTMITGDEKYYQTTTEIEKNIHMDAKLFTNAVYIKQGEIDSLLSQDPAQRKKLMGRLIGTEDLENAWDSMPAVIDAFEDKIEPGIEEKIEEARKKASEAETEVGGLKEELRRVEGLLKVENERLTAEKAKMEEVARLDEELSAASDLSKDAQRLMEEAERAEEQRAKMKKHKKGYEEYVQLTREVEKLEDLESNVRASIDEARAKWEETLEKLRDKIADKKAEENRLRKASNELEDAVGNCPVCGRELNEEHKKRILDEYDAELRKIKSARTTLEKSYKNMEEEADKEHEKATKELKSRLSGLKGEREGYQDSYREYIAAESYLKEFASKEDRLREDLASIKKRLSNKWKSIEGDAKKAALYDRLRDVQKEEWQPMVRSVGRELQRALETVNDGLKRLEREQGRLEGELKGATANRKRYTEEIVTHEAKAKENDKLLRFISLLNEIRVLFDKDHLQKELRARHKPRIERYTREHFDKFNLAYTDVELTDDYSLMVYDATGERSSDMLSGGEKIAAALALRFGIANDLLESASAMELMILDEPTIHLDEQRRQELVEMVKHLSSIPQTIVVTHDREFEAAADRLILVRKEDGVSKVEYKGG